MAPFLGIGPARNGMDHGDQNVVGTVRFGSDGRDMAAVGDDQIFIGQKTKGDCHIIKTLFTNGFPFLVPIRLGGFRQQVRKWFLDNIPVQFGKDGAGLLVGHLDHTIPVQ
ncbi:hypothetical protein C21_04750 [Arenibacter sp. NBRC 103722]|nr:hypothetical protein C21_04750 [Arenibacter sp. NBRC 103722]